MMLRRKCSNDHGNLCSSDLRAGLRTDVQAYLWCRATAEGSEGAGQGEACHRPLHNVSESHHQVRLCSGARQNGGGAPSQGDTVLILHVYYNTLHQPAIVLLFLGLTGPPSPVRLFLLQTACQALQRSQHATLVRGSFCASCPFSMSRHCLMCGVWVCGRRRRKRTLSEPRAVSHRKHLRSQSRHSLEQCQFGPRPAWRPSWQWSTENLLSWRAVSLFRRRQRTFRGRLL